MSDTEDQDKNTIRNDGGILTGPALVSGAKLVYEVAKGVYLSAKTDKPILMQLLSSSYSDRTGKKEGRHHIVIRLSSAHLHSTVIESIYIKDAPKESASVEIIPGPRILGDEEMDYRFSCPFILYPNDWIDILVTVPTIRLSNTRDNGTHLICDFAPIDKLGDTLEVSMPVRLYWGEIRGSSMGLDDKDKNNIRYPSGFLE